MAKVLDNQHITNQYYLLRTDACQPVIPGQFFMLRAWEDYPTLSRPISIYNVNEKSRGLDFLYEVRGVGTEYLNRLKPGDDICVFGPYGNTFPLNVEELAMVGGGVGTAPFYYLSKEIKRRNPKARLTFYLGEREGMELERAFADLDVELRIKKGGLVTDILDVDRHENIYVCGPVAMMKAVTELAMQRGKDTYISMENRMGCGVGACLSCTCETKQGRARVCKEGPIFKGSDIFGK